MRIQPVHQGTLSFFQDLPIVIESTAAQLSSDAGLLAIREFDERIGLTRSFTAVLNDARDPELLEHSFLDMTRARTYGILADYVDQNDSAFTSTRSVGPSAAMHMADTAHQSGSGN